MFSRHSAAALVAALLTVLFASCGTQGLPVDRGGSDAFNIEVAPESFSPGGSAEVGLTVSGTGDLVHVDIFARDADALKALVFELGYDRTALHPVSAEPTTVLGDAGTLLTLVLLDQPEVQFGMALPNPEQCAGFSGDGVLARVSFARGVAPAVRSASATTHDDRSRTTLTVDTGTGELRWLYYNVGDCDQNREVHAADLVPIAGNYGTKGGPFDPATVQSVVDCDNNGEIGQPDIAPIAASYTRVVEGYNLYAAATADAYPADNSAPSTLTPVLTVPITAAQGESVRKFFTLAAPDFTYDPTMYYWVRPFHGTDEGTPSTLLDPTGGGVGLPPVIELITADPGQIMAGETSTITVTAHDPEGGDLTYTWLAFPGGTTGTGNVVTYTAPAFVAAQTEAFITVVVRDEDNNQAQTDVTVTVDPQPVEPVTEVHVYFAPVAAGGSGSVGDPFALDDTATYTLTAEDQDGNDITAEVIFIVTNEPGNPSPFDDARIENDTELRLNTPFAQGFHVTAVYAQGTPDEVTSDADTDSTHFTAAPPF